MKGGKKSRGVSVLSFERLSISCRKYQLEPLIHLRPQTKSVGLVFLCYHLFSLSNSEKYSMNEPSALKEMPSFGSLIEAVSF